jgi:hypothetical protein
MLHELRGAFGELAIEMADSFGEQTGWIYAPITLLGFLAGGISFLYQEWGRPLSVLFAHAVIVGGFFCGFLGIILWILSAHISLRKKDKYKKSEKEFQLELIARSALNEVSNLIQAANNLTEKNISKWEDDIDAFMNKNFPGDSYQKMVMDEKVLNIDVQGKMLAKMARNLRGGRIPRTINLSNIDRVEFKLIVLEWISDILTPVTLGPFRLMKNSP